MKLESKENSLNIIKIFCKGHIANIIFNGKILKAFLLRSRKRFLPCPFLFLFSIPVFEMLAKKDLKGRNMVMYEIRKINN